MAVDPNNPATYSGVPTNQWTPGQLITTGTLGPSKVSDYGSTPVYWADGTQLTNPNYIIPAGAQISLGAPPSAASSGGNAVTGTGIVDQGIQKEGVEGTLLNNAQQNANQLAIAQAQLQQSAQQAAQQYATAQANYNLSAAQAQQQYQLDAANFGLSKAQALYQERLGQANLILQQSQAQLANANFSLQQNQFNASQAQAKESARENILSMINSRTGPQDYVAYNNLLNGLNAPNPQKSTTIDPFAGLDALYQPSNITPPAVPQLPDLTGDINAINSVQAPGAVSYPAFPSAGDQTAPTINAPSLSDIYSQFANASGGGGNTTQGPYGGTVQTSNVGGLAGGGGQPYGDLASYMGAPGTTGTMSNGTPYTNAGYGTPTGSAGKMPFPANANAPTQLYTEIGSAPLQRLAGGGNAAQPPVAIVGDGHGTQPGKNAELAMALVDSVTGRPVLRVLNHQQAAPIIDASRVPRAANGGMYVPRAASGGTYGDALNSPTITTNVYGAGTLGSLPFYQKLTGQSPNRSYGAFGATVSNPAQGIYNAPTAINLRNYNALLPSEQQMFTSLYGQGLSLNPDDILAMAQNAAPTTSDYSSYGMRQQATVYGG